MRAATSAPCWRIPQRWGRRSSPTEPVRPCRRGGPVAARGRLRPARPATDGPAAVRRAGCLRRTSRGEARPPNHSRAWRAGRAFASPRGRVREHSRQAEPGAQAPGPHHLRGRNRRARVETGTPVRHGGPGRLLGQADPAAQAPEGPQVHPDRPRQLQRGHGPHDPRAGVPGRQHAQGRRQRDGREAQVQRRWKTSTPAGSSSRSSP